MTSLQKPAEFAVEQDRLLNSLPVPLAATMAQQMARQDRLFPVERRELDRTLQSLMPPRAQAADQTVRAFAAIRLSPELLRLDWRSDAAGFVERMTAELWSSGQIDAFRKAAAQLVRPALAAETGKTGQAPRFVAIVLDRQLQASGADPALFRRLRSYGTFFPHVNDEQGMHALEQWVVSRAAANPEPYAHWYIAGDLLKNANSAPVVSLSWDGLRTARQQLLARFNAARNSATSGGPEGLRQALLYVTPEQAGLGSMEDPILRTFTMDIFTEGSGTQLYATTFVQWTIREALRRAQPRTLLAQFTPRSEAVSMDIRFTHPELEPPPDRVGSLIDAEMGAYLSYLNLKRLPDTESATFLVWHERYGQALLIGNSMPAGTQSASAMTMERMLKLTT